MKKNRFFIIALLFVSFNTNAQQQIVVGKNYTNPNQVSLVAERGTSTTLKFDLNELNFIEIETDYGKTVKLFSENATVMLEAGSPEMFYLYTGIIIPDVGSAELSITHNEYTDIENVDIIPSKGNLSRSIDPDTVPYVKGEVYEQNAFFPGTLATLTETFIMRDVRGITIFAYPVQYNPVTKVLRIYSEITVTVNYTDQPGENEFTTQKRHQSLDPVFNQMYNNLFINYNSLTRAFPTIEEGELLIICHSTFLDDMQPYVDWKRTIGRKTTLVSTTTTGATNIAIKNYINTYYNSPDHNLAYVLLVGDNAQIPHNGTSSVPSDISYGKISGGQYLDVLIGRMSAENEAHVQTQVQRSIEYERDMKTSDTWLSTGVGLAYNEGSGGGHDGGEADYTHINNIRTRLMAYGYNPVYQEYYGNCPGVTNTSVSQISSRFNAGAGVANYCNHGQKIGWCFSNTCALSYSTTQVNLLQNAGKLPYIFSVACQNGNFISGAECFAEAWLRATQNNQPTGAIATFMATIDLSWIPPMTAQDEFADLCLGISHTAGGFNYGQSAYYFRTIAGAMLNASQRMYQRHTNQGLSDYNSWCVFGDPTLQFRTKTPQEMTVSHSHIISAGATSLTVNCNADDALAALTYIENNEVKILGTALVQSGAAQITFPAVDAGLTLKLTVTGFNRVTYTDAITVTGSSPQFCEKPINVSVEVDRCTAFISWNKPENIDGVLIKYILYLNGDVYEFDYFTTEAIITLIPIHMYSSIPCSIQLRAVYEHCESDLTDEINFVLCLPQLCEPPQNPAAVLEENCCYAMITWDKPENIDGILLGYNVFRNGEQLNKEPIIEQKYRDTIPIALKYIITYQISTVYEHCNSDPTDEIELNVPWSVGNYQDFSFNIYPNPTMGVLNLIQERISNYKIGHELHSGTNIEIYDVYGIKQKAESRNGEKEIVVNISELSAGIYFVKISTESGIVTKKVIKY